jgi:hypothetical protein
MGVGSPCIDFGQGISERANIVQDADLVALEGVGQMLHRMLILKLAVAKAP